MRNLIILSLFITVVVFVMTLSIYVYYITPLSEFSYQTTALVTMDTAGFDVNTSAITFGSVAIGGSSTRTILVNNSYSFPIRVEPEVEGPIEKLITYEPSIIGPNQASKLVFTVYAGTSELLGNYSGNISIKLLRA